MSQWKLYAYKIIQIIAATCIIFIFFLNDVHAKTKIKSQCPNFEQIQTEIDQNQDFWTQVTDIKFKDPHASIPFMQEAVKKLYLLKKLSKNEKNIYFPKLKQDNCKTISLTYGSEESKLYEIRDKSPYKISFNEPGVNEYLKEQIFRIKRFYGKKNIEHVRRIIFTHETPCMKNGEPSTHKESSVIEIYTLNSWYKEIPQKRVISDRLLKLLTAQIKAENVKSQDRSIASCE